MVAKNSAFAIPRVSSVIGQHSNTASASGSTRGRSPGWTMLSASGSGPGVRRTPTIEAPSARSLRAVDFPISPNPTITQCVDAISRNLIRFHSALACEVRRACPLPKKSNAAHKTHSAIASDWACPLVYMSALAPKACSMGCSSPAALDWNHFRSLACKAAPAKLATPGQNQASVVPKTTFGSGAAIASPDQPALKLPSSSITTIFRICS